MSHRNYLTRNPTPYSCYPVPFSFSLSIRTLQFCILFPALSLMTLEFPLYLSRDYLLVRLFLAFCALPRRIHLRSIIQLSASFSLGCAHYFRLLFLQRLYYSYYLYCELSFLLCFWLWPCLFYTTTVLPHILWAVYYLLPPLSPFTQGLHLSSAIPLAVHTLHPSLLTHADTFSVSIFCHSVLTFGAGVALKCSPPLSKFPRAKQYSPTSLHFFLNHILMSLGTPKISTISDLPFQYFRSHPPILTVSLPISSENISSLYLVVLVVGNVQVTGTSQF